MAQKHKTLYTTERGEFHQERAVASAPPELEIVMLREPNKTRILAHAVGVTYFLSERTGVISADLLENMPSLKLILRLGSMTHDIDTSAAKNAGVIVCYQPIFSVIRVAEHAFLQMLTLTKNLYEVGGVARAASDEWQESRRTDEDTFAYNWSNRQGIEQLYNRTVGILGFGEIGAELARRLHGWNCTILYHKRRRLPEHVEHELNITYTGRDNLIAASDFLVNFLPYSPSTDMSLNAETFASMKDGAYVVSAGSGSVIDEAALANAVRSGKLGGAALDTYEWEPIKPDNPMLKLAIDGANVVLTPHTAAGSYTAEIANHERLQDYTNIIRHLRGDPIFNRIV